MQTLQGQIDEQDAMLSRMRNEYGHELLLEGPQVLQVGSMSKCVLNTAAMHKDEAIYIGHSRQSI